MSPSNLLRLADAEAALGRLASLLDVFDAEASDQPLDADVEEFVNYVRAMELGLQRLSALPFSSRLIREMHAVILAGVRGAGRQPGELRTTQNWIGPAGATIESATFVPPPPEDLAELLSDLERFVHEAPSCRRSSRPRSCTTSSRRSSRSSTATAGSAAC